MHSKFFIVKVCSEVTYVKSDHREFGRN